MDRYNRVIQEVSATVDSMGYYDEKEKVYKINSDTIECVKELIRVLRKDGSHFPILRHLGALNIVEKDLIQIIKDHCLKDEALADYTIRLLVSLTYPALVFFKEKMPDSADYKRIYLQINGFLRVYKTVFSRDVKVWKVLCEKAMSIAAKNSIDQSEEEKILLERILILIRNILHVPVDTFLEFGADDDEIISGDMIMTFKESGVLDAIVQLSSNPETYQFCFHLLEIIASLLREQSPEFLTLEDGQNDHVNKKRKTCAAAVESIELEQMKQQEKRMKNFARVSRFNRFKDATYLVKNVKSIGANDLIYHKTTEDPRKISLDLDKTATRKPKNRAPMQDTGSIHYNKLTINFRRPSIRVRKLLKEFCGNFLQEAYNSLMAYVKSALENRNAQENDETYYFSVAYFFMEFNRNSKGDPALIEETFNSEYFHYLHTKVESYLEQIENSRSDRVSIKAWSRRLHISLKAYKELLFTIASMKNVKEERMLYLAKDMSDKVFYELDYRELLLNLISGYDEKKMCPQLLRDLIETNHVFLKMLELYSKSNENFVIKTKRKKRKKKTTKKGKEEQLELVEKIWQEIVTELDEAIQGKIELPSADDVPEVSAYDFASDKTKDEQKEDALYRISKFLKQKKITQALALCRNARNEFGFSEDAPFGVPDLSPEEEVSILHTIIVTEKWIDRDMEPVEKGLAKKATDKVNENTSENEGGGEGEGTGEGTGDGGDGVNAENQNNEEPVDKENELNEDDEQEDDDHNGVLANESAYQERAFYLNDFVLKYCSSKVVKPYTLALKKFDTNSEIINHAIIRMLHRIAWDCKSPVFFFQLSIFRTFQRCFELSKLERDNKFSEIRSFARYIIRQFISLTDGNDKLLIEILFWKTKKEMHEIEENYVKPEPKEPRKRKEKKGRKKKGKGDDSDIRSDSDDDGRPGPQRGDLSDDSGEGFIPQFQSTQIVPSEKPTEDTQTKNNEKDSDEVADDVNYEELIKEADIPDPYAFEDDDDLLDMNQVLDHVANDDSLDPLDPNEDDVNKEISLVEETQENVAAALSDAETIDGEEEVVISKRKKKIVLDESDDDE